MNRVGLTEFLLILAIVVLIFGANRLPELGRGIGRGLRSYKASLREDANDQS
jgi:sec-independent protein translocase protein TatA